MTTKKRPFGCNLADFGVLNAVEQRLLRDSAAGKPTVIAPIKNDPASRPSRRTSTNTVRAEFIRFLALGGDDENPVHEKGVHLHGAWIAGKLDLSGATCPASLALSSCRFEKSPVFSRARVLGSLVLSGSRLPGFFGDSLICEHDFRFAGGAKATGEFRLLGAQIGGQLDFSNTTIRGARRAMNGEIEYGNAIHADGATTKSDLILSPNFSAVGAVRFLGAHIGGQLQGTGATVSGITAKKRGETEYEYKFEYALNAQGIYVKDMVFLDDGFSAVGGVHLAGARIDSNLEFGGAKLFGKKEEKLFEQTAEKEGEIIYGNALQAEGLVVRGSVALNEDFTAVGTVRLLGAVLDGNLRCKNARFEGVRKSRNGAAVISARAFLADGMVVRGAFFVTNLVPPLYKASLSSARAGRLIDDVSSWGEEIVLDGFKYNTLAGAASTQASVRLAWLDKQRAAHTGQDGSGTEFRPQPWRQLIKVLREMGHKEDARRVAIALEDRLRQAGLVGQPPDHPLVWRWLYQTVSRTGHWLLGKLTAYGYRPQLLLLWIFGVWLACAASYWALAVEGAFAPTSIPIIQNAAYAACWPEEDMPKFKNSVTGQDVELKPGQRIGNWYVCDKLPDAYPHLNPLMYSLDVLLPPVNLNQANSWGPLSPTSSTEWFEIDHVQKADVWKLVARLVFWSETMFGWLVTGLLVAMLTGVVKRTED